MPRSTLLCDTDLLLVLLECGCDACLARLPTACQRVDEQLLKLPNPPICPPPAEVQLSEQPPHPSTSLPPLSVAPRKSKKALRQIWQK